jgi:hypothetical protein
MENLDIVTQYNIKAREFALQYAHVTSEHIISIIASVMMTRDGKGIPGGGFVQSIVSNDLFGAMSRADYECYANLRVIVAAYQYAYLD